VQIVFPSYYSVLTKKIYFFLVSQLLFPPSEALKTTGANASLVYGQPNLTSAIALPIGRSTFNSPSGVGIGSDGTLYVTDSGWNRVLLFPPIPPTANQIDAIDIFGQLDFTSNNFTGVGSVKGPFAVLYDSTYNYLWLCDSLTPRVLRFPFAVVQVQNNIPTLTSQVAFSGRLPNPFVRPKGAHHLFRFVSVSLFPRTRVKLIRMSSDPSSGNVQASKQLFLQPTMIEEVTSNGTVVQTAAFQQYGYQVTISDDANQNQYFQFIINSPASVSFPSQE